MSMDSVMEASSSSTPLVEGMPKCRQPRAQIRGCLGRMQWTNVTDPLGDPLLCDPFYHLRTQLMGFTSLEHPSEQYESETGSGGDSSRSPSLSVMRDVWMDSDWDGDIELPAAHIWLAEGELKKPALQQFLMTRASSLGVSYTDAAYHLPAFLAKLCRVPSTPLRHLFIGRSYFRFPSRSEYGDKHDLVSDADPKGEAGRYRIVKRWNINPLVVDAESKGEAGDCEQARNGTNLLESLVLQVSTETLPILQMEDLKLLCNKFSALGFVFGFSYITTRVLEALAQNGSGMVKQLLLHGISNADHVTLVSQVLRAPHCNLSRLDLLFNTPPDDLNRLLDAIFETSSPLSDLGLNFGGEENISTASCMRAIVSSRVLERLQVLRICTVSCSGILKLLAEGLTHSRCTLRFLDLCIERSFFTSDKAFRSNLRDFFQWLMMHGNSHAAFQALRIGVTSEDELKQLIQNGLAEYLRSSKCSLVWLECFFFYNAGGSVFVRAGEEWELANSLTANFSLCNLSFPWTNLEAKALAASLVQRNVLYKSGQLLKEPQVKPDVVKLFICGHGGVGKSTLCRALLSMAASGGSRLLSSIRRHLLSQTDCRTRGMELHSLAFKGRRGRLTVCDLGGQEEFHVLHHYFMHASNDDLFIVVCKFQTQELRRQSVLEQQLQYWLRFIVSHRSKTSSASYSSPARKPKVIVVVNFFDSSRHPQSVHAMRQIARDGTQFLLQQFSQVLDFGVYAADVVGEDYNNLFGITVTTTGQVVPVTKRLKVLLENALRSALPIPKLCHEVAEKTLPSLLQVGHHLRGFGQRTQSEDSLLIPFSAILKRCSTLLPDDNHQENRCRVEAALKVLHRQGLLVFFPKGEQEKQEVTAGKAGNDPGDSLVITDTGWFYNKLIGTLLGKLLQDEEWSGPHHAPWAWDKRDIKRLLRSNQGCKEEHLEEILRYLQDLELCIPMENGMQLWFPALMKDLVQVPFLNDTEGKVFFGRRLRCRDSSMHLIPFGVFTRLQVRLHKLFTGNASFNLGYGWTSFQKGNVGAVVRFGGDVVHVESSWENKQWIDILIFCPNTANSRIMAAGNDLMDRIKTVIYEICQAADFSGIPTVMLQEWVLQSQTPNPLAVELSHVQAKVKEEGLEECYQEWEDSTCTPVVKLMLEKELKAIVEEQVNSLATIRLEYSFGDGGAEGAEEAVDGHMGSVEMEELSSSSKSEEYIKKGKEPVESEGGVVCESSGEDHQVVRLVSRKLRMFDQRQEQRFADVNAALQMLREDMNEALERLREDIHSLSEQFRNAERNIIANCSTSLLRHELKKGSAHPCHPYLVDPQGKLRPLKDLFTKRARLHFMCESPTDGPHPIQDQKGKEVTIKVREWLAKIAPVMVPALRVLCCAARIAATVYLPSAHVFIPSPDFLVSGLGIEKEGLQQVILPKALAALLDQVPDVHYHRFLTREGSVLQTNEVKEALQLILEHEEIDMARDFALQRVHHSGSDQTFWVCRQHIGKGELLKPIRNPFQY